MLAGADGQLTGRYLVASRRHKAPLVLAYYQIPAKNRMNTAEIFSSVHLVNFYMGTAKLKFNTTFNNQIRKELKLSVEEYLVLLLIAEEIKNPENMGWCPISKKHIASYLDMSERQVYRALAKIYKNGLIEKYQNTPLIRLTTKSYNCLVGIPSAKLAVPLPDREKVTPKEIINTHSQNTLYSSSGGVAKKRPSCPLLNGSPLKGKYPKGHEECTEYILGIEEARGRKFINLAKQYQILHRTLKAGYDFTELDKAIRAAEKKYGEWNFDLTTLAAFLEKGINART